MEDVRSVRWRGGVREYLVHWDDYDDDDDDTWEPLSNLDCDELVAAFERERSGCVHATSSA